MHAAFVVQIDTSGVLVADHILCDSGHVLMQVFLHWHCCWWCMESRTTVVFRVDRGKEFCRGLSPSHEAIAHGVTPVVSLARS